jgi:hypothetical protein
VVDESKFVISLLYLCYIFGIVVCAWA